MTNSCHDDGRHLEFSYINSLVFKIYIESPIIFSNRFILDGNLWKGNIFTKTWAFLNSEKKTVFFYNFSKVAILGKWKKN